MINKRVYSAYDFFASFHQSMTVDWSPTSFRFATCVVTSYLRAAILQSVALRACLRESERYP